MTEAEWEGLRLLEPELQLPVWEDVNYVPFTLGRLTQEQLRAGLVAVRLEDRSDVPLDHSLVCEILRCVWGHE